ncbi:MAG: Alpha/beta family hydrolase [Moraxellaceae bacterium]|jgi:alpha/beta superfamily hydrolase|nr:Alpha/beta family hydrolase [Moraxellaceae bacterium]
MSVNDERSLLLPGPAGAIEARLLLPPAGSARVAVICHPHPLHGGSMDNKVVSTLVRTWRDAGLATLRFNFRGVGASAGSHAHGEGEVDDLLAVLHWLQADQGTSQVWLAGFSFGAWVAAAAVQRLPPGLALQRLVLVAPPVQYPGFAGLEPPAGTLVAQGDDDEVVDAAAVAAWVASRRQPPELIRWDKTGHFFHGRLSALKAELAARMFPGQ